MTSINRFTPTFSPSLRTFPTRGLLSIFDVSSGRNHEAVYSTGDDACLYGERLGSAGSAGHLREQREKEEHKGLDPQRIRTTGPDAAGNRRSTEADRTIAAAGAEQGPSGAATAAETGPKPVCGCRSAKQGRSRRRSGCTTAAVSDPTQQ